MLINPYFAYATTFKDGFYKITFDKESNKKASSHKIENTSNYWQTNQAITQIGDKIICKVIDNSHFIVYDHLKDKKDKIYTIQGTISQIKQYKENSVIICAETNFYYFDLKNLKKLSFPIKDIYVFIFFKKRMELKLLQIILFVIIVVLKN